MAKLAIRGHATRGKEVIELLEMLGGKNQNNVYSGKDTFHYYFIDNETGYIRTKLYTDDCWTKLTYTIFTLEEFLEKFPYKIGDRVRVAEYESEVRIDDMKWDGNEIQYEVFTDMTEWYSAEELNIFNEPTNNTFENMLDTLSSYLGDILTPKGVEKAIKYIRENMDEYSKPQYTNTYPQYPSNYEECIGQLPINWDLEVKGHKSDLLYNFQKLLIARDVYWKLYGEQMGLGKPWEPDWGNVDEHKYVICRLYTGIVTEVTGGWPRILAFPTEEMRDIFYENFKNLIETCKELL